MSNQELERTFKQLESAYGQFIERTRLGRKLELLKIVRMCLVMRGACHDSDVGECLTQFQLACERLTRQHPPVGSDEHQDLETGLAQLRLMREKLHYGSHVFPEFRERRVGTRRRSPPSSAFGHLRAF